MNSNLQVWLGDPSIIDQQVKWEWIKFKVRESAMKFAKEKSRLNKDRIADLTDYYYYYYYYLFGINHKTKLQNSETMIKIQGSNNRASNTCQEEKKS